MAKTAIGPNNPCKACLAYGDPEPCKKGAGKLVSALRGGGCVHYRRQKCMAWAGMQAPKPKKKKDDDDSDELDEPMPKRQRGGNRDVPPILSKIYQIKDSRMCKLDCETKLMEDDPLSYARRNYATEHEPIDQLLEYKVYGLFKSDFDEDGKNDTHWLSVERITGEYGVGVMEADKAIEQYQLNYLYVRTAHMSRAITAWSAQSVSANPLESATA